MKGRYLINRRPRSVMVRIIKSKYVRLALDNSGDGGKLFGTTIYV